jgi:hypothetical protein
MVNSEREIMYLPKQASVIVNTNEFPAMKQALTKVSVKAEADSKRPSLLTSEQSCPAPPKLLYDPDKPIDAICSTLQTVPVESPASSASVCRSAMNGGPAK